MNAAQSLLAGVDEDGKGSLFVQVFGFEELNLPQSMEFVIHEQPFLVNFLENESY